MIDESGQTSGFGIVMQTEAALSTDAEPVGYGVFTKNKRQAEYRFSNLVSDTEEDANELGREYYTDRFIVKPLYTAPPAPSVAVKALRWKGPDSYGEYHSLDGLWGYIIRCEDDGHWLTEVGDYFPSPEAAKAAAQADYETRIRSALSAQAQAQDVACQTCNGTGKEARHQICRDCDESTADVWQLVPIEPSAGMIAAAKSTTSAVLTKSHATEIYRAMIAAAPTNQEG